MWRGQVCLELTGLEKQGSVKHSSLLKIALLSNVFTTVLPLPTPPNTPPIPAWEFHADAPLLHGLQEEMLLLLARLCQQ